MMYVIVVQPISAAFASDLCLIVEGIWLFLFLAIKEEENVNFRTLKISKNIRILTAKRRTTLLPR